MATCSPKEKVLSELLELLKLEKIEENIFRGQSQDLGFGNIFGGQVLGQSLSAATQTVNDGRSAHSMHGYFLWPGDPALPIIYEVDCIRDGKSFTTRRVKAIQKGRAIFSMSASFHRDEGGFDHQAEMPDAPDPESLTSQVETARKFKDLIPEPIRVQLTCDRPIEIRPVDPVNPFNPDKRPPHRQVWFRALNPLETDDPAVHRYMLAYASDFGLAATALYPHGRTFWDPAMQMASMDHALWFHRDFRIDDWLLYTMESPSASHSLGMARGMVFTKDGTLVATVCQECLIRYRPKDAR